MIKTGKCVSNNDQTHHRKCREEFSELVEQCYCNTPLMGLKPISPHDAATHSVDVTAQGKLNPNTSAPHHCTAQTCQESQHGASWHSSWHRHSYLADKPLVAVWEKMMTQGTLAPTMSTTKLSIKSHENSYMPPIYPFMPKLSTTVICDSIYFKRSHPLNWLLKPRWSSNHSGGE